MTAHWLSALRTPLFGREIKISAATMWAIFWVGAGSFIPLLFLQYVGEEGTSTIAAQEMHASGDFLRTTIYGQNTGRPGLYGWLILALTRVVGEQHILIAARLVAVSSTLLLGLTLAWLVRRLFNDRVARGVCGRGVSVRRRAALSRLAGLCRPAIFVVHVRRDKRAVGGGRGAAAQSSVSRRARPDRIVSDQGGNRLRLLRRIGLVLLWRHRNRRISLLRLGRS